MTHQEKEEVFFKYQDMARKLAWDFSRLYRRDHEDMLSYVYLLLAEEIYGQDCKYDSMKGSFSTYIYHRIYWHLKELCVRNRYLHTKDFAELHWREILANESPVVAKKRTWLDNLLQELSEEGKALVQILLEAPEELKQGIHPQAPKRSKQMLRDYLIDVIDWDEYKFQLAWEELEKAIV